MPDIAFVYEVIWKVIVGLLAVILYLEKGWRKRIETDIKDLKERFPERRVFEGMDSIRRHVRRLTDK